MAKNNYKPRNVRNTRSGLNGPILFLCISILIFLVLVIVFAYNSFKNRIPEDTMAHILSTESPKPTSQPSTSSSPSTPQPTPIETLPAIPFFPPPYSDETLYDTVILNARLINPDTLQDLENYNIGIKDGRIAALTKRPLLGRETVDATGLIASPGFIDIDSYEISPIGARHKIMDGVTTNLLMHGGTRNASDWYNRYNNNPPLINYGASNFVTQLRGDLGYGAYSVMSNANHIAQMVATSEQNLLNGALGISMSPEYTPGLQGEEQRALVELAARYNVTTYYHLRYSTPYGENNSLSAIQEVIDLAREFGVSTHILHISSTGATYVTDEAYAMVDGARAEGLDITADIYPYDSWATYLNSARFSAGWQERFGLTYSDLQLANSTERLTATTFSEYRNSGRLVIANGSIPEAEVRIALQKPYVFIASDTIIESHFDSHPRGSGSFSRTIGHYARDEGVITLMEALSKLTILPARRLDSASDDIKRKGRLEIGADADIVLFDYDTIIDTATVENVASYSEGIEYVWVNGIPGVTPDGVINNTRAGKPIYSRFFNPAEPEEYFTYTLSYDGEEKGTLNAFELFNIHFIDLREAAGILGLEYEAFENGGIKFGQAELKMGETGFTSYEQHSNLKHEPLIYKSSVYAPISDLVYLLDKTSFELK